MAYLQTTMKKYNILAAIALGALIASCGDGKKNDTPEESAFLLDTSGMKETYKLGETLELGITNPQNEKIDSIQYLINDKRVGSAPAGKKLPVVLNGYKLGYQEIRAMVYRGGESTGATGRVEIAAGKAPELLKYEIVNTYPHDMTSYTQGLEFYRDTLFEGTGQYGESKLRKVDYKTGKVYKQIELAGRFFGEGITIFNNKVYQLTWRENTGFIYDAGSLKKEKDFTYFKDIEGWGLTHDDKYLYQSDGSEKIYKLDPATLKEADYVNVYTESSKIKAVNELEWVNGKIYGNIYQKDAIAVIDPATGTVEGVLNLAELKGKVTQHPELDVLNGIAYNPKTKTLFVTGKNWDKMFEIRIK